MLSKNAISLILIIVVDIFRIMIFKVLKNFKVQLCLMMESLLVFDYLTATFNLSYNQTFYCLSKASLPEIQNLISVSNMISS